jgi:hypothetical protein
MANFTRKEIPFLHKGMSWNAPPEKLADGVPNWAKNVRVLQQGTISAAHGFTTKFTAPGRDFIHSMARLNVLNPAFDSDLSRTYVLGADYQLNVFQDQATLNNNTLNPVTTPQGIAGFSGNPLSIVDMQPVGAAVAWKYIGDSQQMCSVGYYPTDQYGVNMARCLTMGMDPPVITAGPPVQAPIAGTDGGLTIGGQYQWCYVFRNLQKGSRSNPSCATRQSAATPALTIVSNAALAAAVNLFTPDVPKDPQTGNPDPNVVVDIYRFGGTIFRWALVGTSTGATTFVDTTPDSALLAAPAPSQITDASTGLTRFNLFRPFVTQDIERTGSAVTYQGGPGAPMYLDSSSTGSTFNTQWLPGSTIYAAGAAFTIYQVIDDTKVELAGDVTGTLASGLTVDWSTSAGTLMAGQPLSHLWGPYGIGQSGSYIFGCGDPNNEGTMYWCNGNDPDSTDVVNNIVVTSPSEKLVTGCVYAGQPYAWSTERQFQIFPSLTIFGQFTSQEVAGAKGVWLEWSLSVQSNGISDQSVTWRGKDGIYDMSANAGLQRLTDPLYLFFPHDGQPGIAPETIITQINATSQFPENVGNLDDTQPQYHRITWFQGVLFYDFVALTTNINTGVVSNTFSTLVWDSVNIPGGGWVSLDQPFADTSAPVARCLEIGANQIPIDAAIEPGPIYGPAARGGNLLVLRSLDNSSTPAEPTIYDYYGYTRGFQSRVITKAEDIGDSRAPKLWGDYWVNCTPINSISFYPLGDFNVSPLLPSEAVPGLVPGPPDQQNQFTFDFQEFLNAGTPGYAQLATGLLTTTLGLDIIWTAADGQFTETLNTWQPSYVLKPEFIEFRASDPDDAGAVQAKYLMGANITANTINQVCSVNVLVNGEAIATLQMQHPTQSTKPYAWTPVAGYEFQVQLTLGPAADALQLFKINWIFEPWPDAIARTYPFQNLGTSGEKYIKGIVMPMETGGEPASLTCWADDSNSTIEWTNQSTPALKKTGKVLDLPNGPFTAHEIQFATLTNSRIWPGEAKIDFDPWPESSTDASSFMNMGYTGAKWIQGAVIPMETGGNPVQLKVTSDCGTSITLPPFTTPALCKNDYAVSFSPCYSPPSDAFIGHEVQVQPLANGRVWYDEIKWVWEPMPELVPTWFTQPTDLDLPGWHSLRDCYIAYMGGSGTPILTIITEYGQIQYTLDPVTSNQYTRCYRPLQPQKAKWRQFRVECCGGIRLFIKDCEVKAKAWGDTGPYKSFAPFGDLSRTNGGARI